MNESMINAAIEYIKDLFRDRADGHEAEHSLRVYRNAMKIVEGETAADPEIVALAALLHDTDDHKLFKTENNANARAFLNRQNLEPEKIEQICDAINAVSFSQNRGRRPETIEGKIVQDADRLDALGAIGIARTFAFGGMHGRSMDSNIQHFYDKLLLLKDEMNTTRGKEMAQTRHAFLETFLEEYKKESGDQK